QSTYGYADFQISFIVIFLGATPLNVKRSIPTGGVSNDTCKTISINIPNQTCSILRLVTTGIKIGSVIIMMEISSMNMPRKKTTTSIQTKIHKGLNGRSEIV